MNGLLIVDDEEGIRLSLRTALRREGYEVLTAATGQEAVALVQRDPAAVDIVISDYRMPGMDGLETLALIGNANPDICRIILTGYASLDAAIRATNQGIDGFLTKPFENKELRHKVREYFVHKFLKRFLSPQVLGEVVARPERLQPRRQKVSLLFSDIRGFSNIAEQSDPAYLLADLAGDYINPLSDIAFKHDGTLLEYFGDGILVVYGAPVAREDDERRAVEAALEMRARMAMLNEQRRNHGKPALEVAISVVTGEALVGLLGSRHKRAYAAFGTTVIRGARMEKLAAPGQILIDEATQQATRGWIEGRRLSPVAVKGLEAPLTLYELASSRAPGG